LITGFIKGPPHYPQKQHCCAFIWHCLEGMPQWQLELHGNRAAMQQADSIAEQWNSVVQQRVVDATWWMRVVLQMGVPPGEGDDRKEGWAWVDTQPGQDTEVLEAYRLADLVSNTLRLQVRMQFWRAASVSELSA
jgi:hypothetical protein